MAMDQMYTDCLRGLEEMKAENAALAAHVERLGALGMMVRDAAVDMDMEPDEFWDRIEKWETGWIDTPATSLARLKAHQWQMAADHLARRIRLVCESAEDAVRECETLRDKARQAEEGL